MIAPIAVFEPGTEPGSPAPRSGAIRATERQGRGWTGCRTRFRTGFGTRFAWRRGLTPGSVSC